MIGPNGDPMGTIKVTKPMVEKITKFTKLRNMITDFLKTTGKRELVNFSEFSLEEKDELIEASTDALKIEEALLPIYQKYFTSEEMLDIISFFRSKTGQKYIAQQQNVSDDVVEKVVPKLILEMTANLVDEIGKKRRGSGS